MCSVACYYWKQLVKQRSGYIALHLGRFRHIFLCSYALESDYQASQLLMSPHLFGDFELYDMQLRWVVLLAINQLFNPLG